MTEAGRPIPPFSEDEVVDYFVTEAIKMKLDHDQMKQERDNKRRKFRGSHRDPEFKKQAAAS